MRLGHRDRASGALPSERSGEESGHVAARMSSTAYLAFASSRSSAESAREATKTRASSTYIGKYVSSVILRRRN